MYVFVAAAEDLLHRHSFLCALVWMLRRTIAAVASGQQQEKIEIRVARLKLF